VAWFGAKQGLSAWAWCCAVLGAKQTS